MEQKSGQDNQLISGEQQEEQQQMIMKPKLKQVQFSREENEEELTIKGKTKKHQEAEEEQKEHLPEFLTLTASGALKKCNQTSNLDLELLYDSRILSHEVKESFKDIEKSRLLSIATKNQVVHLVEQGTSIDFSSCRSLIEYMSQKGFNYNEAYSLQFLAQGGESYVLTADLKQPQEIVVKTVLPDKVSQKAMTNIISESHMIKLLENHEHVVQIFEEIIEFNKASNSVMNYLVVTEQARTDMSHIVKIWQDEEKKYEKLEFYSKRKLFYFFLRTCQALEYLHSQNIYYGDMKEANILVFRNYSVKLGDFGISIKMDPTIDPDDEVYELKGLTKGYSIPKMEESMSEDEGQLYSRLQLIENDYYGLQRTFERVLKANQVFINKSKSFNNSYLKRLVDDIQLLDPRENPLKKVLEKYEKLLEEDTLFFEIACQKLTSHEKYSTIPNFLKLWVHKKVPILIQKYFYSQENQEFSFLHLHQKTLIPEDQANYSLTYEQEKQLVDKGAVLAELRSYIDAQQNFYKTFARIVPFLVRSKGPLLPTFYNSFYKELFSSYYQLTADSSSIPLMSFEYSDRATWEELMSKYRACNFDSENGILLFSFLLFYGGIADAESKHLIKAFDLMEQPFFDMIKDNPRENPLFMKLLFDKIDFNDKMNLPLNFQISDKAEFVFHHGLIRIMNLDCKVSKLQSLEEQEREYFQLFSEPLQEDIRYAQNLQLGNKIKTKLFQKIFPNSHQQLHDMYQTRQQILKRSYGALGNEVASNSHEIFNFNRAHFCSSYKLSSTVQSMYEQALINLKKACAYSTKSMRQVYLIDLLEEQQCQGETEKIKETVEFYKELNPFLYQVVHAHYVQPINLTPEQEDATYLQLFENYGLLSKMCRYNNKVLEMIIKLLRLDDDLKYAQLHYFYNKVMKERALEMMMKEIRVKQLEGEQEFVVEKMGRVEAFIDSSMIYGEVKIDFVDNSELRAEYNEGILSGRVVYRLPDGTSYEEEYENGLKEGAFTFSSYSETLKGEFSNGELQFLSNQDLKDKYVGQFKHNLRHGTGVYFSRTKEPGNVHFYYGNLKESALPGPFQSGVWEYGVLKNGLELEYSGEIVHAYRKQADIINGKYSGIAITHLSGEKTKKLVTFYLKGKKVGREFYFLNDQELYKEKELNEGSGLTKILKYFTEGQVSAKYQKDRQGITGKYVKYYKEGQVRMEVEYKEGKKEGKCIEYYPNGKVFSEREFENNVRKGAILFFDEQGNSMGEYNKVEDEKVGIKFWLGELGKIQKQRIYEEGELSYELINNLNGCKQLEKKFQEQKAIFYDLSGNILGEMGNKLGVQYSYYPTGEVLEKRSKEKGQPKQIQKFFKDGTLQYHYYEEQDEVVEVFFDQSGEEFDRVVNGTGGMATYYESGQLKEVSGLRKYEKDGIVQIYYENGNMRSEENWETDKLNGKSYYYSLDGKYKYEIVYENSNFVSYTSFSANNTQIGSQLGLEVTKNGVFCDFYSNGNLMHLEQFQNNLLNGKRLQFYYNGNLMRESFYVDGKLEGEEKFYYYQGGILKTSMFKGGELCGQTLFFDQNGQLDAALDINEGQGKMEIVNEAFANLKEL